MNDSNTVVVRPAGALRGRVRVPGDKSISHRYALVGAIADGETTIEGYGSGADCRSTLTCLQTLGVHIDLSHGTANRVTVRLVGRGPTGFAEPGAVLDAGNSGTTTRLLLGLLAAQPFTTTVTGDDSLRRRPMRRVIAPLTAMGAVIQSSDGRLPIQIRGGRLAPLDFRPEMPSAQVKSAVLLAGLHAVGVTSVHEPIPTRDHTERALRTFGATVETGQGGVRIAGGQRLTGRRLGVPGDISSAAFWAVAAAAVPGSDIELDHVGLNPTRTAILDVLRRAGARIDVQIERSAADEPVGRVRVRHAALRPLTIDPVEVPGLIDELPALAALATHGGEMTVRGAAELRVKESDRITSLASGLRALGAEIDEFPDGFHVRGTRRLAGGRADAAADHRLAMAFAIAALGATSPSTIGGADAVAVSYPEFFDVLESIVA